MDLFKVKKEKGFFAKVRHDRYLTAEQGYLVWYKSKTEGWLLGRIESQTHNELSITALSADGQALVS